MTAGVPLAEALVRWGDPALVAEMTQLANEGYDGPLIAWLDEPSSEDERKYFRHQALRGQLEQTLGEKLRQGTLIAIGFDVRAPADAPAITIPPERWRSLVPNYDDSSAADAGVAIAGILVHERDPATTMTATTPMLEAGRLTHTATISRIRLEIDLGTRRVRFDDRDLRLSPRSFALLLILAKAALSSDGLVSVQDIEARLWRKVPIDKKAIGDAIGKLKGELVKQGVDEIAVRLLIENRRSEGYWLTLPRGEIQIVG